MARISVDNGYSFCSVEAALESFPIDVIAYFMDDDTRESVARDLAPCSDIDFVSEYLMRAPSNLIIGQASPLHHDKNGSFSGSFLNAMAVK